MIGKLIKNVPVGVLSVLVVLAIAYFSLWPDPVGEQEVMLFEGADKVIHFTMYFGATMVFITDMVKFRYPHHVRANLSLALMMVAVTLGVLMEAGQLVMRLGRSFDVYDMMSNALGALAGFLVMFFFGERYVRHSLRGHSHRRHHRSDSA